MCHKSFSPLFNEYNSHKIVVLMMQDGLKTAQLFAKKKDPRTKDPHIISQLYFICSYTLTHRLFFCFFVFSYCVYYKGRQKNESLIQVI